MMKHELEAEIFMELWHLVGMAESVLIMQKSATADELAKTLNDKLKKIWKKAEEVKS